MKKLLPFVCFLALVTIIFGTIEVAVQQSQRSAANDPQIQIAEDSAANLNGGLSPQNIGESKTDIKNSLMPFVVIYDKSGKIVSGNGYLNNKLPIVPKGVLTSSDNKPYHSVTWQPQDKVRVAAVVVSAKDYYVLAGRSMTEVEKQEQHTMELVGFGWLCSIVFILLGTYLYPKPASKVSKRN